MYLDIMHNHPQYFNFHSDEAKDLLTKLLQKDPEKRLANAS
jgi:hypothetical protein